MKKTKFRKGIRQRTKAKGRNSTATNQPPTRQAGEQPPKELKDKSVRNNRSGLAVTILQ
jgi:hypothetical protein